MTSALTAEAPKRAATTNRNFESNIVTPEGKGLIIRAILNPVAYGLNFFGLKGAIALFGRGHSFVVSTFHRYDEPGLIGVSGNDKFERRI